MQPLKLLPHVGMVLSFITIPALAQPLSRGASGEDGDFWLETRSSSLRGDQMVDQVFTYRRSDGPTLQLKLESARQERQRPEWPPIWLLEVARIQPDGTLLPLCKPDPEDQRLAIPYPDRSAPDGYRFTCSSGANGKCLRSGYLPWHVSANGTVLAPFHQACVHLLRADYGADGRSWTQPGVRVDVSDVLGLITPEAGYRFEAGWGPTGAVCLAQPRIPQTHSLQEIATALPQLSSSLGPERCTEKEARRLGAILFSGLSAE